MKAPVELSLDQLNTIILNSSSSEQLANHKDAILTLVNQCKISIDSLLELDSNTLMSAIEHVDDLVRLLKQDTESKAQMVVEHFSKLHSIKRSEEEIKEVFERLNNSFINLLSHLEIECVKYILNLKDPQFQYCLFMVPEVWDFIGKLGIKFEDVEKMDLRLRDYFIDTIHRTMGQFGGLGKISFQQLLEILKKRTPKDSPFLGIPRGSDEANVFIRDLNKAAIVYKNMKEEVEKNASCLSYLQYDSTSLFSKLPPETLVKISSLMGDKDNVITNDKEFIDIAYNKFLS